ncbi:MAG: hypothetical protein ACI8T1_002774 [Verrucomicrobiales bacterium]|jgi:hypothetical protein
MKGRVLSIAFGLLAFVGGIALAIWGAREWQSALSSKDWPTVPGTILQSEVTKKMKARRPGQKSHQTRTQFTSEIRYSYVVNETCYTGARVSYSDYSSSNEAQMEAVVARYPKGKSVTVYYEPENSSNSLLESGFGWTPVAIIAVGVVFTLVGGITLLRTRRV